MPKGRISFITSETVGPLFHILERFLVFVTRSPARQSFLTASKVKSKLQLKLIKLQNQPNPTPVIWRSISNLKTKLLSLQRKTSVFKPFLRRRDFRSSSRVRIKQGFYRNRTEPGLGGVRLMKKFTCLPSVRSLRVSNRKLKKRGLSWWGSVRGSGVACRKLALLKQLRYRRLLFLSSREFNHRDHNNVQRYVERIRSLRARQVVLRNYRYIRLMSASTKRNMALGGGLSIGLAKRASKANSKVSFQGYKYLRSLSRISKIPLRPITWTKRFFRKQRRKIVRRMKFSQTTGTGTGGFSRWDIRPSRHKVRNRYYDKLVRYYRKWWTARHVRLGRFGCNLHSYILYLKGFDPKFFHHVFTYVLKKFMRTLTQHSVRMRKRWFRFLLKLFLYRMLMKTMSNPPSSLGGRVLRRQGALLETGSEVSDLPPFDDLSLFRDYKADVLINKDGC